MSYGNWTSWTYQLVWNSESWQGDYPVYQVYIGYRYAQDAANNKTAIQAFHRFYQNASDRGVQGCTYNWQINSVSGESITVGSAPTHNDTATYQWETAGGGSKTITWYADMPDAGDWDTPTAASGSFSISTPAIRQASTITEAPNCNLGESSTIEWNIVPSGARYYYKLKISMGGHTETVSYNTISRGAELYTYTFAISTWGNYIPTNAKYGTATAKLYTYLDSGLTTLVGSASTKTFTVTMTSAQGKPTGLSISVAINNTAQSKFGSTPVSNYSKAEITFAKTLKYNATLKSMTISGGIGADITSETSPYLTNTITKSGSQTFKITVTDSRGFSSSVTSSAITFVTYSAPTISSLSLSRGTSSATTIYVKPKWSDGSASIPSLANYISKSLWLKGNGGTYTELSDTITNNTKTALSGTYSDTSSFTFKLKVTDSISESWSAETTVTTKSVLMDFCPPSTSSQVGGVAIGKIAEDSNVFDVGFQTKISHASDPEVLVLKRAASDTDTRLTAIEFQNNGGKIGRIGMTRGSADQCHAYRYDENDNQYTILDTGNVNNYITYITSQGTSGDWTYIKYSNGAIELWGRPLFTEAITSAAGSLYTSSAVTYNIPSSIGVTNISNGVATISGTYCVGRTASISALGSSSINIRVSSFQSETRSSGMYVSIHLIGTWS